MCYFSTWNMLLCLPQRQSPDGGRISVRRVTLLSNSGRIRTPEYKSMNQSYWIALSLSLLGALSGVLALVINGYNYWIKRRPRLRLFVSYHFTGNTGNTGTPQRLVLFALVRIGNTSERPAHLYLETMRAKILFEECWYPAEIMACETDTLCTDFSDVEQRHIGLKSSIKPFDKFDPAVVSLDNPYARFVPITCANGHVLNKAERLRLEVKDSSLKCHIIEADILRKDPGGARSCE